MCKKTCYGFINMVYSKQSGGIWCMEFPVLWKKNVLYNCFFFHWNSTRIFFLVHAVDMTAWSSVTLSTSAYWQGSKVEPVQWATPGWFTRGGFMHGHKNQSRLCFMKSALGYRDTGFSFGFMTEKSLAVASASEPWFDMLVWMPLC